MTHWKCYCGEPAIRMGESCPSCGWSGHDDGEAAEIAWARVRKLQDERTKLVRDLEMSDRELTAAREQQET